MSKAGTDRLESELALYFARKLEIDRLKEKHKLLPRDIIESRPGQVKERVAAYELELTALQNAWKDQDGAAQTSIRTEA